MSRDKITLAIVVFLALSLGTWAFLFFSNYKPAYNAEAPAPAPAASTENWKTWSDFYGSVPNGDYQGYQLMYPRDFDVFRGDQANGGFIGKSKVQLRFPQDAFQPPQYQKSNFGEAYLTFSVGSDQESIDNCYVNTEGGEGGSSALKQTKTINGIDFRFGTGVGVGAGQIYTSEIYRALVDQRCIEMVSTVHTGNIGNYDPPVAEFDKEQAFSVLRQIAGTFKLVSQTP